MIFDTQFGRLITKLRSREDYKRTLFILLGDHGFALSDYENNYPGRYGSEKNRIAMAILSESPGVLDSFVVSDAVVSQIDIAPTILGVTGIDKPNHFMGIDLRKQQGNESAAFFFKDKTFSFHDKIQDVYGELGENVVYRKKDSIFVSSTGSADSVFIASINRMANFYRYLLMKDLIWDSTLND